MVGGSHDDTYVVHNATDVIVEQANGGVDTVNSWSGSYTLPANVENINLMGNWGQTATGNAADNIIKSLGGGNDTIDGGGGHDLLVAGTGTDTFLFKAMNYEGSVVQGFKLGQDHLGLHLAPKSVGYAGTDPCADHYL